MSCVDVNYLDKGKNNNGEDSTEVLLWIKGDQCFTKEEFEKIVEAGINFYNSINPQKPKDNPKEQYQGC